MAVFTQVNANQLSDFLKQYALGELLNFEGITAGIENTNYFVSTTQGQYVLTLFEKLSRAELPFYIGLMGHLAAQGIAVPQPQQTLQGQTIQSLNGKPCSLVSRLPGRWIVEPEALHCSIVGQTLAQAHLAASSFHLQHKNPRGLSWWQSTAPSLIPFLDSPRQALLAQELEAQQQFSASATYQALPQGPIHADLFRDNVLFDGAQLGGLIDFYFAGVETWLFDVAVCVNDWCIDQNTGAFESLKLESFVLAYTQIRPFSAAERSAWPLMLRAAALRFWISRLYDFYLPRPAETLIPKDPEHFERILRLRCSQTYPLLP